MRRPATEGPQLATSWGLAEGEEIAPGRTALKRLGGGRRYDAYLAWDQTMRAVVVAKIVRPHLVEDERTLHGLAAESSMIDRLAHPVILRGFGAVLGGPMPHLVLEHLEGPRLSSLIRKYGPLVAEQLVPLAVQLAAAAHYLSGEGIVHLDIKPSNTIMGAPPRLIDLSVAQTHQAALALTSNVGTDAYMAPEQCLPDGPEPVGAPADVWGIGVTLYRAACGRLPYDEPNPECDNPVDRFAQLRQEPDPLDAELPAPLIEAIMDCLAYEPQARPTAAELGDRLEPVLGAQPRPRFGRRKPGGR